MPVFRKFTGPGRIPKWFDDDISAHHLVCRRCDTPSQAIVPVCTGCNTSVFLHLKRKVATTEYNGPATNDSLFLQMREAQAQLIHVEQLIKNLQATRRALKEFINIRRFKVAPIMNLSKDVLASIFEFLGPTNNIAVPKAMPALVPSQVCRDFRDIVLSSPRLWKTIRIRPWTPQTTREESQLQNAIKSMTKRLQICAERSGSMPMDLSVLSWPEPYIGLDETFPAASAPFFQYLSTLIPRLRLISVTYCRFMVDWIHAQPTLLQVSFPQLRFYSERQIYQVNLNLSFLQGALCLQELHVSTIAEDLRLVDFIPSKRMESLFGHMSICALTDFPLDNLQSLEFFNPWSFSSNSIPKLSLPSLRSLKVTGDYSSSKVGPIPINWFSQLCCPRLENLSLKFAYFETSQSHAFQGLLEMLEAPVKNSTFYQLSLSYCSFTDSQLRSLRTSVPSITSF
ncbi:hypothetical protein DL96DRAFT_1703664 [Flagelloscypha sp. PMI_526]|nr:hypothetical protein DL96DRAFT_1703664 [Flagelloscypha sp. PMI_526]